MQCITLVCIVKKDPTNGKKIFKYNDSYCPPLDKKEIDTLIKSIDGKDYNTVKMTYCIFCN